MFLSHDLVLGSYQKLGSYMSLRLTVFNFGGSFLFCFFFFWGNPSKKIFTPQCTFSIFLLKTLMTLKQSFYLHSVWIFSSETNGEFDFQLQIFQMRPLVYIKEGIIVLSDFKCMSDLPGKTDFFFPHILLVNQEFAGFQRVYFDRIVLVCVLSA